MAVDPTALAYGLVGLAAGTGVYLWRSKAELEERCEFLDDIGQDLQQAFEFAGDILKDERTPKPIRWAILLLLAAHSDNVRGKELALLFISAQQRKDDETTEGGDPISQSMENLVKYAPPLARKTHRVMASLIFGLVFLNLADNIKVKKVRDAAAKDPAILWARISRIFSPGNDHDHHQGGLQPA